MTTPGEPYSDLDRAFDDAVGRGFNTIRICAMPLMLFGLKAEDGTASKMLSFSKFGGEFGQRTRWYNVVGGAEFDGREHLARLFESARKHRCQVILSSWEYQQSLAFLASDKLFKMALKVPPEDRFRLLGHSMGELIEFLKDQGYKDQIAYAEIHNEVNVTPRLREIIRTGESGYGPVKAQIPYIDEALLELKRRHPDIMATASYTSSILPLENLHELPNNMQVAHFHIYAKGMFRELQSKLIDPSEPFPSKFAQSMLRQDAPPIQDWRPDGDWRLQLYDWDDQMMFYINDWMDPEKWDSYLNERFPAHKEAIRQQIMTRLEAYSDFAKNRGVPCVIGEGYLGWSPLLAGFEDGPAAKEIYEFAVGECLRLGYWGTILCQDASPENKLWADASWLKEINDRILSIQSRN